MLKSETKCFNNNKTVQIPKWSDCKIKLKDNIFSVSTKHGTSNLYLPAKIDISSDFITIKSKFSFHKKIKDIILYHHKQFFVILRLKGSNFRFQIDKLLNLEVGKSHKTNFQIPSSLTVKRYGESKDSFIVSGVSSIEVNNFIFNLRKVRPVNPYTGSGLLLNKEKPKLKQGKKK